MSEERNLKNLFTNIYHGELTEGKHTVKVEDFVFNINTLPTTSIIAMTNIEKALGINLTNDMHGVSNIKLDQILALFQVYEPTDKDYFTLICTTEEGRILRKNMFTKDFAVFLKQTRIQLLGSNTEDINPFDWISGMLQKNLDIWVSYLEVPTRADITKIRRVQNINYCEPFKVEAKTDETEETGDSPKPF